MQAQSTLAVAECAAAAGVASDGERILAAASAEKPYTRADLCLRPHPQRRFRPS